MSSWFDTRYPRDRNGRRDNPRFDKGLFPAASATNTSNAPVVTEPPKVTLDPIQSRIMGEIVPKSMLITGPAGTGKSVLANEAIAAMRARGQKVKVTASTGIAAIHVGGTTIHSFLGTTICSSISEAQNAESYSINDRALYRIRAADVIVVDEVSMLTGDYIDMMDWRLRDVCNSDVPFAGKQILFFGDFLQLPPVIKGHRVERTFAFQAEAWQKAGVLTRMLTINHRQGEDAEFAEHLQAIRVGELTKDMEKFFKVCVGRKLRKAIVLYPTNAAVDATNKIKLAKIPGEARMYPAVLSGDPKACDMLIRNCIADVELRVKVGAQVLLIKNCYESGNEYMNGERGTLTAMDDEMITVDVETENNQRSVNLRPEMWNWKDGDESTRASLRQFPCKLGYAVTIHKSQGMTLERMRCDLTRCFLPGQAYVALSRAKNAKHLSLERPIRKAQIFADKTCVAFYESSTPKAQMVKAGKKRKN